MSTLESAKFYRIYNINEWIFLRTDICRGRVKVELDLPNYALKAELKNATGVDRSEFGEKDRFS